AGRITHGTGVRVTYFAQEPTSSLDPENSVLDEVLADRPMTPEAVRTYLGRFLFNGEDVFKQVAMLSGGERQRLSLAKMLLDEPNVLLLDEPTNHLDIPSREALEAALRDFTGTILVATHDRYLLERLTTRILTIRDGRIADFQGTYHELRERQAKNARRGVAPVASPPRRPAKQVRKTQAAAPTFDDVAAEITAVERDLEDAGRHLSDPELYRDPDRVKGMRQQYEGAERRLAQLYDLLEALEAHSPSPRPGT
ncbi:MAG TPA: ATP-binding cassette domain-containing protein, partial [bacterium]|nr:ATP-binding cassette domain-containing protein [bacterium]